MPFIIYNIIMDKVKVKIIKSLYPYKAGDEVEMRKPVAERRAKSGYLTIIWQEIIAKKEEFEEKKENKSMEKKAKKKK